MEDILFIHQNCLILKENERQKVMLAPMIEYILQVPGLEISQNKIYGGECDSCKFELNKNTLLFSIDAIGSYFRPWYSM